MDFRFQNITSGDSQSDFANKLNYNFSNLVTLGGGLFGNNGAEGAAGKNGVRGITGPQGSQGYRGSKWFVQATSPTSGVLLGDYLVNTSLDCEVFKYEDVDGSTEWVSQNFLISQYGVFGISNYQTGSTSGVPGSSYIQNLSNPGTKTLSLTCATGANIKNPQLSKTVIGTGGTTGYPLLEFSKYTNQSNSLFNLNSPKFKWATANTASSDVYGLSWLSKDGISFNTRNFSVDSYGTINLYAGQHNSVNRGGITGDFSGSVSFNSSGNYNTSFTGLISLASDYWQVSSRNVPMWSNSGLTANTSVEIYSEVSLDPTLYVRDGINYTRSGSMYTASDYLARVKYLGDSAESGSLSSDKDLFLTSTDGNVKYPAKISPFQYPGYVATGTSLATGTFNAAFESISGQNFYTIVPTISKAAESSTVNRWSFGEMRYLEYGTGYDATGLNALCVSIPKDSSYGQDGFSYLVDGLNEAIVFSVYAFFGVNAIILDVPNSSPTTSFNFTGSSTNFSLIVPGDSSKYANNVEITLIRQDASDDWFCYYSASGGNINGTATVGFAFGGASCGCLYN